MIFDELFKDVLGNALKILFVVSSEFLSRIKK
jgi:hypothetical protein